MWTLHMDLIAFVQLNNTYNGVHLGQALYKAVKHLDIIYRVYDLLATLVYIGNKRSQWHRGKKGK